MYVFRRYMWNKLENHLLFYDRKIPLIHFMLVVKVQGGGGFQKIVVSNLRSGQRSD